jgi:hypothetical protein
MKRIFPYLLPTLASVLFAVVLASAYTMGPRMLNMDGDLGRHLTVGEYILDTHTIPLHDIFSHTLPGEALTPHEWLSQVLFTLFFRLFGLSGPVLLSAVCVSLAIWITFRAAFIKSESLLAALFCVVIGMAASSLHWLTRPHIFTFLFLALWLKGLEQMRYGRKGYIPAWIWMTLLMLIWANMHGAFIAGFAVWLIYGVSYCWDRWVERDEADYSSGFGRIFLITGGMSFFATLINPDGPGLWKTSIGYLGNQYLVGHTAEYLSPNFHLSTFWPFLLMLMMGLALFGLADKRRRTVDLVLFIAWGAMALISARNIPLFVLVSVPLLSVTLKEVVDLFGEQAKFFDNLRSFDRRLSRVESAARGLVWPILIVVIAFFLTGIGFGRESNRFDSRVFPVAAVDWLADHPQQGEVFNYFPWGGYLLYRNWPETRVFIDGQTDFYGESLTRSYEQVISLQPGWEDVLAKYGVGWVLIPADEPLSSELARRSEWKEVYHDPLVAGIIMTSDKPANLEAASK